MEIGGDRRGGCGGMRLAAAFRCHVGEAGFNHSADQGSGEGLVDGELNGAFGNGVGLEVIPELLDDSGGREEAAMVGEGGEPDEDLFVLEGGDAVADDLGGFRWGDRAYHGAHGFESSASGFRDEGQILVDGLRKFFGARPRGVFPSGGFFRARAARRLSGLHEAMLSEVSMRVQTRRGENLSNDEIQISKTRQSFSANFVLMA